MAPCWSREVKPMVSGRSPVSPSSEKRPLAVAVEGSPVVGGCEEDGFYVFLCNGHAEFVVPADSLSVSASKVNLFCKGKVVATFDRASVIAATRQPLMPPLFG